MGALQPRSLGRARLLAHLSEHLHQMLAAAHLQREEDGSDPVRFVVHREVDYVGLGGRDLGGDAPKRTTLVAGLHLEHPAEQPVYFRRDYHASPKNHG